MKVIIKKTKNAIRIIKTYGVVIDFYYILKTHIALFLNRNKKMKRTILN